MLAGRALTRSVAAALLEPSGELRAGNAILNVAFTGGAALGPGIAGLVVAGFGVPTALLLDAVSFYLIAWILFTAGSMPRAEPEPGRLRERVRAGIAYIRGQRTLRRLLVAQGAAFVFFSAVIPVEVIYAKETLGAGDSGYGLMLASWGVGMVLGGIVFAAIRQAPLPYLLFFSTIGVGAGYLGLAVATVSAVQELTVAGMQARVMSVLESIGAALPGVGFALGGVTAAVIGPRATFLIAGLGVLAIVAVAVPFLGRNWPDRLEDPGSYELDGANDVVLELIPGGSPVQIDLEVRR